MRKGNEREIREKECELEFVVERGAWGTDGSLQMVICDSRFVATEIARRFLTCVRSLWFGPTSDGYGLWVWQLATHSKKNEDER